jgi:hypothetical protein
LLKPIITSELGAKQEPVRISLPLTTVADRVRMIVALITAACIVIATNCLASLKIKFL